MVYWIYMHNKEELDSFCAPRTNNCVAKLIDQGISLPGYVSIADRVAFFVLRDRWTTVEKEFGFFILQNDDATLQWQVHDAGNPLLPSNAFPANPQLISDRLYFGHVKMNGKDVFGPVYDDAICYLPIPEVMGINVKTFLILTWYTEDKDRINELESRIGVIE